jgi:hypothetical protein
MPRFGKVPKEVPRETGVDNLAPVFRSKLEAVLEEMEAAGFDPIIAETIRTDARQRFLHGFGREYDDGRGIVTHSEDADETWHHFGLAADVWSRSKLWKAPDDFWRKLHELGRKHGLVSGADWDNDGVMDDWDKPHLQMGPPMRRSPSPRASRLQAQGGNQAVWKEVKAA